MLVYEFCLFVFFSCAHSAHTSKCRSSDSYLRAFFKWPWAQCRPFFSSGRFYCSFYRCIDAWNDLNDFPHVLFHFSKQLKEDVRRIDPQVDEFLKDSETLLDEHELSDQDHRTIELESESLRDRWSKVKEDAKSRESRFVDGLFKLPLSENGFMHTSFLESVCFSS